jgi:hypothetical protein
LDQGSVLKQSYLNADGSTNQLDSQSEMKFSDNQVTVQGIDSVNVKTRRNSKLQLLNET